MIECGTLLCLCSALKKLEKAKKAAEEKKAKIAESAPKKAAKSQNAEQDDEDMDPTVRILKFTIEFLIGFQVDRFDCSGSSLGV